METYHEPARETPVTYQPDVVVCGGGVTGCAAAISAARCGALLLLAERNGVLGGVATAGLMANTTNMLRADEDVTVVKGAYFADVEHSVRRKPTSDFGDVDHPVGADATPAVGMIDQLWASVNAESLLLIDSPVISIL